MKATIEIKNVPEEYEKYIVARYDEATKSFWFWGSWDDGTKAKEVAEEVNGIIAEVI